MSKNEVQNVLEEEFIDKNVMKVWSIKGKSIDTYHTDDVVENSLSETSATISSIIDASANEKEIVKKITRRTVNKYRGGEK